MSPSELMSLLESKLTAQEMASVERVLRELIAEGRIILDCNRKLTLLDESAKEKE